MLWDYLGTQLTSPLLHFSFWVYLIGAVVLSGGIGIWVEIARHMQGEENAAAISTALYTFYPALAVGAIAQLLIDEQNPKYVRSFAIASTLALVLVTLPRLLHFVDHECVAFLLGILGCIGATLLWWIANGGSQTFKDFPPADATVGGNQGNEPPGSLEGIQH